MRWSDFYIDVALSSYMAIFFFFLIVVFGFLALLKDAILDAIIRKLGGLAGLLRCVAWCLGLAVLLAGASGLFTSCLVSLFIFFDTGSFVAKNAGVQLGGFAIGFLFIAAGVIVLRLIELPDIDASAVISDEEFARQQSMLWRWLKQGLIATGIALAALQTLPLLKLMPDVLQANPIGGTLSAFGIGLFWSSGDYLFQRSRKYTPPKI